MKYTKHILFIVVLLSVTFWHVNGHPVANIEENVINKDEKRYPNGSVIGRYIYNDNKGNPIHVRYYADDTSYGVELKSIKVVSAAPTGTEKLSKYPLQITEHSFESALDPFVGIKDLLNFNNNFTNAAVQPHKDKAKSNPKNAAEFEVLMQNELKAPEKCGKEKVKVYFDKDKRKTRDVPVDNDSVNYCNRV